MDTSFQFRSRRFNVSEPKDYFINPACYGDDLAEWLIEKLNDLSIKTGRAPEQEDFGWFATFVVNEVEHCIVVGFQPNDAALGDCWVGWIERNVGFLKSILGERDQGVLPEAISVVDSILSSAPEIQDLVWLPNRST